MNNIISSRWLQAVGAALLLLCFVVRPAQAVSITLGDRIDITSTTFARPIQIADAIGVSEWFLDLTYDPTDVQVNVGCDPFSGDIYCSLFTGPVTEGDFFAAGAPFNLLIPGFVELDPITFMQAGRLFGMHGAFGGFPPAPSGSGILAYIQFTVLGTGDGPIDPDGSVISVPEPGTLVLFAIGLAWLIGRRILARVALGVVASLSLCGVAAAQLGPIIDLPDLPTVMPSPTAGAFPPTVAPTAAGTYSAPPAWSQTLAPNVRFVILSNFNSDAVLDRETGLVWSRRSLGRAFAGFFDRPVEKIEQLCQILPIGDRFGWRLPAVAELQSLIDTSVPLSSAPSLPVGHPFWLSPGGRNLNNSYWTGEAFFAEVAGERIFVRRAVELTEGRTGAFRTPQTSFVLDADMLCVRGDPTPVPHAPDSPQ
jgi:hypothetical protein